MVDLLGRALLANADGCLGCGVCVGLGAVWDAVLARHDVINAVLWSCCV